MLLVDEVGGEKQVLGRAEFGKLTMTVRELLDARIALEHEAVLEVRAEKLRLSQAAAAEHIRGVVGSREWRLNGPGKTFRPGLFVPGCAGALPERETLLRQAEEGFAANRFFVLLDDRQAESLDEVVEVERTGEVTFFLLTPLQGG
jgi:hypothetical protein